MGIFYGGIGVVIAWVFSLALGSSIIYLSYHIRYKIPLIELIPKASRTLVMTCLICILSALLIQYKLNHTPVNTIILNGMVIFSFSIIIFVPVWRHPMRKRLIGWVTDELLNRNAGAR
ncbi:MAG: hypothetical protein DDT40_01723 [candidate division WS2 bacterium]|nr:hypothetical protein [Candidatus Psychracetigena formicireducens]